MFRWLREPVQRLNPSKLTARNKAAHVPTIILTQRQRVLGLAGGRDGGVAGAIALLAEDAVAYWMMA
jgi:hypothetical protein